MSWRSGQVLHMLDVILSCIDLWGLMSGFLRHYSCLFLSFATVVFFTAKLALSNFLEGQAVHRFLLCTFCARSVVSTVLWYLLFLVGLMIIHLSWCLRVSSGRGLCLLRSVASLYTVSLGVPGLPGPHGFWVFLSCCDEIPSLWISSLQSGRGSGILALSFLSCPRCVRLPLTLLFSGLFTRPGFFGTLCLVASHLVCHRLLLSRQAPLVLLALLGDSCRLLHLLASLARRGGITGTCAVFFISWQLRPLRRSKEGAGVIST